MALTQDQLVEEISTLSLLQAADLVKALEDKLGVSAAAPVAAAAAAGNGAGPAEAVEEQTEFDVILSGAGDKKIQVIKVVRAATGLGLKEAKDLVDSAPTAVKEGINKDDAEKLRAEIEEAGGLVEVK